MKHWLYLIGFILIASTAGCRPEEQLKKAEQAGPIGSEWFSPVTSTTNLWRPVMNDQQSTLYEFDIPMPDVTENTISGSIIMVYGKLMGYERYIWQRDKVGLFPLALNTNATLTTFDFWKVDIQPGKAIVSVQNTDNNYTTGTLNSGHQFRYIIIPKTGGIVTGQKPDGLEVLARYSEVELRQMTYEELCEVTGLKK